jgi:hypothetical protein
MGTVGVVSAFGRRRSAGAVLVLALALVTSVACTETWPPRRTTTTSTTTTMPSYYQARDFVASLDRLSSGPARVVVEGTLITSSPGYRARLVPAAEQADPNVLALDVDITPPAPGTLVPGILGQVPLYFETRATYERVLIPQLKLDLPVQPRRLLAFPEPGELPAGVTDARAFFATAGPGGPAGADQLLVWGFVELNSAAYTARLVPAFPQGINPRILLLRLETFVNDAIVPPVTVNRGVRFEGAADYDEVTILDVGANIRVQRVEGPR